MKICLIGKYPPIQGGVSTRTYAFAHSLARQGHQVHVVTNAKDVRLPFRLFMRPADWDRCEADYGDGFVRVHWTDRADAGQYHIPMSPAYVTKLASLAIDVCGANEIDIIFGFYMEPYGIAAFMAASATSLPYVLKTAGSDAGRLWQQTQFRPLYDHVFRNARRVIAGGFIRDALLEVGVDRKNIWPDPSFTVPENLFTPEGPALDVQELLAAAAEDPRFSEMAFGRYRKDLTYIGVYGKLGEKKGSFALLEAVRKLVDQDIKAGLLVLGQERPRSKTEFRKVIEKLGLEEHVVQLPFIPNWRVPEFIRRCVAVCALEQDFPIEAHAPITPREIMVNGGCIVGSLEMLKKLPNPQKLIDGFNCVAVKDVFDTDALADRLKSVLAAPGPAKAIGLEARVYAQSEQARMPFPDRLSAILSGALDPEDGANETELPKNDADETHSDPAPSVNGHYSNDIDPRVQSDLDLITKTVETAGSIERDDPVDPLERSFARFCGGKTLFDRSGFAALSPSPSRILSFCELKFDGNELLHYLSAGVLPDGFTERPNSLVVAGSPNGELRVLVLDELTTNVMRYCDGNNSVADISHAVSSTGGIENVLLDLLRNDLVSFPEY